MSLPKTRLPSLRPRSTESLSLVFDRYTTLPRVSTYRGGLWERNEIQCHLCSDFRVRDEGRGYTNFRISSGRERIPCSRPTPKERVLLPLSPNVREHEETSLGVTTRRPPSFSRETGNPVPRTRSDRKILRVFLICPEIKVDGDLERFFPAVTGVVQSR